jgi:hypothetical protein
MYMYMYFRLLDDFNTSVTSKLTWPFLDMTNILKHILIHVFVLTVFKNILNGSCKIY